MRLSVLNRKVHRWAAVLIALPLVFVIATGLLLQLKKQWPWVQPTEQRGSGTAPALTPSRMLDICKTVPEAEIADWPDIARIDIRPSRGLTKVTARNNWEIQLDSQSGEVLQVAYRRSDIIEALHDGSWFTDGVKYGVFLPAGITLFLLWCTGLYLFILPYWVKWRRKPASVSAKSPVHPSET